MRPTRLPISSSASRNCGERSAKAMLSFTSRTGSRLKPSKTMATSRVAGSASVTSRPAKLTRPASSSISPAEASSVELFPAPVGPSRANISLSLTVRSRPRSAVLPR